MTAANWLITGCSQLVTLRGPVSRRGGALGELSIVRDGALLVRSGRIEAISTRRRIEKLRESRHSEKLDLGGRVVLPGFVDSHTHLIFPASRANEYEQRISGATYEQIARKGGGIQSTVKALRRASTQALKNRALRFLREFAAHGTTTIEAKSGYGLDWKNESRILQVLGQLRQEQPLDIARTFLGAHVVPSEFRKCPEAFIDLLVERFIPAVAKARLAEFCDVFCERGAFTVAQSRRILNAGKAYGLIPRIHAEQLTRSGAARLAIELQAASADHLDQINAADIRALGASNVTCTLLPGCSFHLGLSHCAPARKLIDAGAILVLATDFNPGTSPTVSMPMILSLACTQMRMTPAEAIAAATINPAYSLRMHDRVGSLDVGKYADLAAFDVDDYREIPYYFGVNLCGMTMKRGVIIYSKDSKQ
ncbi:MAG TPA: imidazolonepropionase [Candidatus Acidoferrales bacterium]|jgi:imidazolonepropionase|nr:imidazolonepropionase [Candidatus Acidoferrales bacterium]